MPRRLIASRSAGATPYFLSVLSGALLGLSFPNSNIWLFAWFSFVPLFLALKNKSKGKAFLLAYISGIIFWGCTIYWLVHVTLLGTLVLILYLALYFGLFGLISSYLLHTKYYTLSLSSLWVLLEYARAYLLTGFPWALLGYSQSFNLPAIQIIDITGPWGASFLVMAVNAGVYSVIGYRLSVIGSVRRDKYIFIPLLLLIFSLSYGYYQLRRTPDTGHRTPIKISVIQPNIPQDLKWKPVAASFIFNKYILLSLRAAQEKPDLIIWPEAALPYCLGEGPDDYRELTASIRGLKTPLLLGAVTIRNNLYYNSALLFSRQGALQQAYDKVHLVPFGEYIPLKNIFSFLETIAPIGDIARGKAYTVFKVSGGSAGEAAGLGALICFEDLFPEIARRFIKEGASGLVNITNDAWYLKTSAAAQHLQASVFRAVENRTNLIRAANTGISGFISPTGKLIALVRDKSGNNIFIEGVLTRDVGLSKPKATFYARHGDIFVIFCLLPMLYGIISNPKKE